MAIAYSIGIGPRASLHHAYQYAQDSARDHGTENHSPCAKNITVPTPRPWVSRELVRERMTLWVAHVYFDSRLLSGINSFNE